MGGSALVVAVVGLCAGFRAGGSAVAIAVRILRAHRAGAGRGLALHIAVIGVRVHARGGHLLTRSGAAGELAIAGIAVIAVARVRAVGLGGVLAGIVGARLAVGLLRSGVA